MKKSEKVFLVEDLAAQIRDAKSLLFVNLTGINVNQQEELRKILRNAGAKLMVVKNTLLGRAAGKVIREQLFGPTAVILSEKDEIAPLQALGKFIKSFEIPKLKFGYISGNIYDAEALLRLSRLPGQKVMQGQVVGALVGPLYGLVGVLQGNLTKLVYTLNELKIQKSNVN